MDASAVVNTWQFNFLRSSTLEHYSPNSIKEHKYYEILGEASDESLTQREETVKSTEPQLAARSTPYLLYHLGQVITP